MIVEIVLIILLLSIGFLYYRQDKIISNQNEYINSIENTLLQNYDSISKALEKMKEIDGKGGFESDDEVGQIFRSLNDELNKLQREINNER
tara:strand:+ start:247 stop:519 length:273 start_codon:yes stop_codon:yes gene_type:complete